MTVQVAQGTSPCCTPWRAVSHGGRGILDYLSDRGGNLQVPPPNQSGYLVIHIKATVVKLQSIQCFTFRRCWMNGLSYNASCVREDSWLQATEIGCGSLTGRREFSKGISRAHKFVGSQESQVLCSRNSSQGHLSRNWKVYALKWLLR